MNPSPAFTLEHFQSQVQRITHAVKGDKPERVAEVASELVAQFLFDHHRLANAVEVLAQTRKPGLFDNRR